MIIIRGELIPKREMLNNSLFDKDKSTFQCLGQSLAQESQAKASIYLIFLRRDSLFSFSAIKTNLHDNVELTDESLSILNDRSQVKIEAKNSNT